MAQREAPTQHKFKVQMYDFSCEGLVDPSGTDQRCEPYLKIDFDNFKIFKTDKGSQGCNPEWGFKAGFHYAINYLERLCSRSLNVQCFNRISGHLIGEASIDLQMIACGPAYYRLTLHSSPDSRESRGILKFTCVMKMVSPNLTVIIRNLRLTMQGCSAPAKLEIFSTLGLEGDEPEQEIHLPHNMEGIWDGPFSMTWEAALSDMLKAPEKEYLRFVARDEAGVRQGEAMLAFRSAFTTKNDTEVPFKVSVTYSCQIDGEEDSHLMEGGKKKKEDPEPVGAVGELEGTLLYINLPVYAQMAGGCCVDGHVEGGCLLIEDLPYPHVLDRAPPLWQDPADRIGMEVFHSDQPNEENEMNFDDIDMQTLNEALEQIDLPTPWEKRRERVGQVGDRSSSRLYFADPRSRRTTWKDPRLLPEEWDQRIDPQSGKVYFQYHKTRQTTFVDPRFCPPGWDMRLSRDGEVYFAYIPAMKTTFIDPRGLPEGVDPALDDYGRMYFKNHHARTTSWDDPRNDQQEVTLTTWRHAQSTRWWKEQIFREIEDMAKMRSEMEEREDEEMDLGN